MADRQTDRQIDRQTERHTNRQNTDGETTNSQTDRTKMERQIHTQTDRTQMETHTHTHKQTEDKRKTHKRHTPGAQHTWCRHVEHDKHIEHHEHEEEGAESVKPQVPKTVVGLEHLLVQLLTLLPVEQFVVPLWIGSCDNTQVSCHLWTDNTQVSCHLWTESALELQPVG